MSKETLNTLKMFAMEDLKRMQAFPLEQKVELAKARIVEWYEHFNGKVAVSFSGGKDSTVLLHIVRSVYPDVPAVYVDTGLEFPAIKKHVKQFDNVTIVRPKLNFLQVITKYGYPIIGKETAQRFHDYRTANEKNYNGYAKDAFYGQGRFKNSHYSVQKWLNLLLNKDFNISHYCCYVLKKRPARQYEKDTKCKFYIGTMAEESRLRLTNWIRHGCNAFEAKHQTSTPLATWTEQDVLEYTVKNKLPIAEPYGQIVFDGCKYCTSGCNRTGCVFCGFGAHLDKGKRFQELKKLEPRLYDYCIGGGEYDNNGLWIPNTNGLGFGHVYDTLNKLYGENFVKYKPEQWGQQTLF